MDCQICTLKFVKTRKEIKCANCEEAACSKCCETYLLDKHDDPDCMYCHKVWTKQFVIDNFTKTFVNGKFKKARQQILFDRERSLFPETLSEIEEEKRIEKIRSNISQVANELSEIRNELKEIRNEFRINNVSLKETKVKAKLYGVSFTGLIKQYKLKIAELRAKRNELQKLLNIKVVEINELHHSLGERVERERINYLFNYNCPNEDCKGMLNSKFECILCEKNSCKKCYTVIKDDEHECNQDDVETFKMLQNKTKPCPKCNALIFKIEGCSQIFCTHCHTPFCWNSGRIISGEFFHNPHYFDFINNGGNSEEVFGENRNERFNRGICGNQRIPYHAIKHKINHHFSLKTIGKIIEKIRHIGEVEIRRYDFDYVENNKHHRHRYLRGKLTEQRFKQQLTTSERRQEKHSLYTDLLNLYVNSIERIISKYFDKYLTWNFEVCEQFMDEVKIHMDFYDKCFQKISSDYKCVKLSYATYEYFYPQN